MTLALRYIQRLPRWSVQPSLQFGSTPRALPLYVGRCGSALIRCSIDTLCPKHRRVPFRRCFRAWLVGWKPTAQLSLATVRTRGHSSARSTRVAWFGAVVRATNPSTRRWPTARRESDDGCARSWWRRFEQTIELRAVFACFRSRGSRFRRIKPDKRNDRRPVFLTRPTLVLFPFLDG